MRKSNNLIVVLYIIIAIFLIWCLVFFAWNRYNIFRLNRYGQEATATIIQKCDGILTYDVEWEGEYFIGTIVVKKYVFRDVKIGEHFPARVIAGKLHYHHNGGITPKYVKIILRKMPDLYQDYDYELCRIDSMYNNRFGI